MAYSNLQKQILRLYRDIVRNCVLGNPVSFIICINYEQEKNRFTRLCKK